MRGKRKERKKRRERKEERRERGREREKDILASFPQSTNTPSCCANPRQKFYGRGYPGKKGYNLCDTQWGWGLKFQRKDVRNTCSVNSSTGEVGRAHGWGSCLLSPLLPHPSHLCQAVPVLMTWYRREDGLEATGQLAVSMGPRRKWAGPTQELAPSMVAPKLTSHLL